MKKVSKYITIMVALLVVFSSCRDEDLVRMPELTSGAVPYLVKDEASDQVIDFFNKETFNTSINYWIGVEEGAELVESVAIVGTYNGGDPVVFSDGAANLPLPAQVSITIDDILNNFGLSIDELEIGDQIIFGADLTMKDGRVLPAFTPTGSFGYAPEIRATPRNDIYSVYFVTCVSNIPVEGTWTSTCTTDWDTETTNANVTIEALGNGEYLFSDVTGGFYALFGFNENQPATVTDVCNSLTITDAAGAQFTIVADPDNTGEWNPDTDTFTVYWWDSGNGIKGETIFTRN